MNDECLTEAKEIYEKIRTALTGRCYDHSALEFTMCLIIMESLSQSCINYTEAIKGVDQMYAYLRDALQRKWNIAQ